MGIWRNIQSDYTAARRNDPAIPAGFRGFLEVVFCTPGFLAITAHRGIHYLHTRWRVPVLPRFISLIVRWWTGIEIHPAAQIGEGFFIDHGAGVVIGETTIVGKNVTLYQGVTLGGTGNEKSHKRHPTLGDNVFVGSGAKILGPIVVGSNSRIGANSVVLKNVPENATVTGMRARIVKVGGRPVSSAGAALSPEELLARIIRLEEELYYLQREFKQCRGDEVEEETEISIGVGKRHIVFEVNGYSVISRLLEGEFLNYKQTIPTTAMTTVEVDTRSLIESIERTSLIITDRTKSLINCVFDTDFIRISSITSLGTASDKVSADVDGSRVEIGFNNRYFIEALRACNTDRVKIILNGAVSPILILPTEGDSFTFLVLPVRLKKNA